jgi:hypothetical protein
MVNSRERRGSPVLEESLWITCGHLGNGPKHHDVITNAVSEGLLGHVSKE